MSKDLKFDDFPIDVPDEVKAAFSGEHKLRAVAKMLQEVLIDTIAGMSDIDPWESVYKHMPEVHKYQREHPDTMLAYDHCTKTFSLKPK